MAAKERLHLGAAVAKQPFDRLERRPARSRRAVARDALTVMVMIVVGTAARGLAGEWRQDEGNSQLPRCTGPEYAVATEALRMMPLPPFTFYATISAVLLASLATTHIVLLVRRARDRRVGIVLDQLARTHGPITCVVPGDGEAIALGPGHLHWVTYDRPPRASLSVPLRRVVHLNVIETGPKSMRFSFRLASGIDTRMLSTADIVQARNLFQLMHASGREIEYLP